MTEAPRPAATAGPYLLQPAGAPHAQRLALLAIALLALSAILVVARFLNRGPGAIPARVLDVVALISATAVPALLASGYVYGGLLQRIMFAVGYIWYAREALRIATRYHRS